MKIVIDVEPSTGMASVKSDEKIERTKMVRILLSLADSIVASVGEPPTLIEPAGVVPIGKGLFS